MEEFCLARISRRALGRVIAETVHRLADRGSAMSTAASAVLITELEDAVNGGSSLLVGAKLGKEAGCSRDECRHVGHLTIKKKSSPVK